MADVGRARWWVGESKSSSSVWTGPTSSLVVLMGPPNAHGAFVVGFDADAAAAEALGRGESRIETEGEENGASSWEYTCKPTRLSV